MTKMLQYVDEMRARLTEVATTEQTLIRALDQALSQVDQELLADVRDLTLAHEARRVAILTELQGLASRIGAFPVTAEPLAATAAGQSQPAIEQVPQPSAQPPPLPGSFEAVRAGDWRQAVSNINDDLDTYFGRTVEH
jgi:hypothetical protein